MRLEFNVLWVEDNRSNVMAQKDAIERKIRREGFRLCVEFAPSVQDATRFLSSDIYGDHVDLVLMDYDLGPGQKGDEGLSAVRDIFPYKDIVFYSGMSTSALLDKVIAQNVQGIFVANRDALPDVVEGVFETLVKKVLDIDHSRGIVMGATSDIDTVIIESMSRSFDGCDTEQKSKILEDVFSRLEKKAADFTQSVEALRALVHLRDLADHHAVYTSDDRLRLMVKIFKMLAVHQDKLTKFDEYRSNVMPKRNDLAHIRVVKSGFARVLYDRRGNQLTTEDMRSLRVKLLEFQELLASLEQ